MTTATTTATERGALQYGIEYAGVVHYELEMRLMTVADNIAALEEVGAASGLKITLAMMSHAIVTLGTIPKAEITWELLANGLADSDYDTLVALQERIKKKRLRSKKDLPATGSSSSPLANTESAKPTSGA